MPLVSAPNLTQTAGGQNLYAVAGAVGPGGGVEQLLAGANISLSPPDGLGVVTITAAGGGGGGGVSSVTATGSGITATPTTGAVVLENTGVTSLTTAPGSGITLAGSTGSVNVSNAGVLSLTTAPGSGITLDGSTGSVNVSNAGVLSLTAGPGIAVGGGGVGNLTVSTVGLPVFTGYQTLAWNGNVAGAPLAITSNLFRVQLTGTDIFFNGPSGGYALTNPILVSNPSWNQYTVVLPVMGGPARFLTGLATTNVCNGSIVCDVRTSFDTRVCDIVGNGPLPSQIGTIGQNPYIYFAVFQGAP
jgi:hypothetical protein